MTPDPLLANLPRLQLPHAARQRVARKRQAERAGKHFGKKREDRRAPHGALMAWGRREPLALVLFAFDFDRRLDHHTRLRDGDHGNHRLGEGKE